MNAPAAEAWSPACMEPDELADWQVFNGRVTSKRERARIPCHDCLPEFAAEMRAAGRCNGTPRGIEKETEMDQAETAAPRSLTPTRRVALDADVETTAPALPGGLTLALSAVVSCDYYLRGQRPRVMTPEGRERQQQGARRATAARLAKRKGTTT